MSPDRREINPEIVRTNQSEVAETQSTVIVPRDKRGRIKWSILKNDPQLRLAIITQEVTQFLTGSSVLTHRALIQAGHGGLSQAIVTYYPDSIRGLRQQLDLGDTIPVGNPESGKVRRVKPLTEDQIREEAAVVYQQFGNISQRGLAEQGRYHLLGEVSRQYPGKLLQLKKDLGIQTRSKPNAWTPERIKEEALVFIQEHGRLTRPFIEKNKRFDLSVAIGRHYPGGIRQLRRDLKLNDPQKPNGFWSLENILKEGAEFVRIHEFISDNLLDSNNQSALSNAVVKSYPGGWRQFRVDLGLEELKKPTRYWTPETIEQEAKQFLEKHGELNPKLLAKEGRMDLVNAIYTGYPDKLRGLYNSLGIEPKRATHTDWTTELIEKQAADFYRENGIFNAKSLDEKKLFALRGAISTKYPGGIRALRKKLGIIDAKSVEQSISPDEANEQLRRLLEE